MREILFRGKNIDDGHWVYGTPISLRNGETHMNFEFMGWIDRAIVIPETVGQYTGLTDKNGVKIFEGDVVKYSEIDIDGSDLVGLGVISWNQKTACFTISNGAYHDDFCQTLIEEIEVIGNIYDNPELLKN